MNSKARLMITSVLIAIGIVSIPIAGILMRQYIISNICNIIIITPPPPPELKLKFYGDISEGSFNFDIVITAEKV